MICFQKQESDTIIVSSYVQGDNFANLIDCAPVNAPTCTSNDSSYLIVYVPINFNSNSDYSIKFKKTGLIYKISEISTIQKECNSCFLKEDTYTELSGYKVNGV